MSSLVSDFIINPVLRQARRFSEISRTTVENHGQEAGQPEAVSAVAEEEHLEDGHVPPLSEQTSLSSGSVEQRADAEQEPSHRRASSGSNHDHLGFPITPKKPGGPIPEDDGMSALRARIHSINARDLPQPEKARLIHETLLEGYRSSRINPLGPANLAKDIPNGRTHEYSSSPPLSLESLKFWQSQVGESAAAEKFLLTDSDLAPTYAPIRQPKNADASKDPPTPPMTDRPLGCPHYERNVKLQCSTCNKWYTCRFCHDAVEEHNLIRNETKHMLCMLCGTPQKAAEVCVNCGETTAQYYCNICKLWENRKSKPIYHCNDCGICRRGLGLGKDFFHCKTCRACITTSIESSHKCIERSTDCDCPICGEYMFTSPKPVVFMTCGHSIHKKCYDQHMKVSYKCPICNKSLANMETQFRNLDVLIRAQPMPAEFQDTKAVILCNDCSGRSTVPYHWLGLKCSICLSYNTAELQISGRNSEMLQPTSNERQDIEPTVDPPRSVAIPTQSRGTAPMNRRRHSSNLDMEVQHLAPERIARSLSPQAMGTESILATIAADDESDSDIFGFWTRSGESSSDDEESVEDEDDSDDLADIDDEDEDDNEIVLFGHR